MLFFRATWSHLYRRHFFFACHTLSEMSHAALGLLLETLPVPLFRQLPRSLLLSDMSTCLQSLQYRICNSCTFGRRLIELVVMLVLTTTASSACMRPIGHHKHWLVERHMLSATTRPAARNSGLKGFQVLHKCNLLLPACKKKQTYSFEEILFE